MKTIDQRVQAGIEFLDKKYGTKWRKKIRLETLDLGHPLYCVLGQTDLGYCVHADKLHLVPSKCRKLGFNIPYPLSNSPSVTYVALTLAWKKALRKLGVK